MKAFRTVLIYVAIIVLAVLLLDAFSVFGKKAEEESYQTFIENVKAGTVAKIIYYDSEYAAEVWAKDAAAEVAQPAEGVEPNYTVTGVPSYEQLNEDLKEIALAAAEGTEHASTADYGIIVEFVEPAGESWLLVLLPYLLMTVLGIVVIVMIMRAQSGNGGVANFAKSHAKVQVGGGAGVKFTDVAGADEEKEELREVVEFMRHPDKFTKMGARIPKGILLIGPPGTGKTLLAKAAAGEAGVPFFSISGSDFVEMFVGVGASRVRDLFTTAKKSSPSVIFIDEIDAVGRHRGAGLGGGHDEREQTLNQLLVEMDGFATNEGIIVIAATNRPDILDPALLRPGRFDRRITVNLPDVKGREEILQVHSKNKKFEPDVSFGHLARSTPGFTGADLENLLNEAAILATRDGKDSIGMKELNESTTRVMMGPEKRSRVITAEDKNITAYHESGHAIAALLLPGCDPVREISVIPRGQAAGYTMTMPGNENSHVSRGKLLDNIAMTLGGRAAEQVALEDICTGAYSDLQHATEVARKMVVEYGMSDKIGPIFLGDDNEVFIGRDFVQHSNFSDAFGSLIDNEIKNLLESQYERVLNILSENKDGLIRAAAALIEREHMTGAEFEAVFYGRSEVVDAPQSLEE